MGQNTAEQREAEIYVHIPFCVRKCAYCDFLSFPSAEAEQGSYRNALLHEIAAASSLLQGRRIRSVFFGGGTPTVLSARQIGSILEMIIRCCRVAKDAEITIECNPGTADREKLNSLRTAGFNRLSIGAQSFDDSLLRKIGRIHDREDILRCYRDARAAGFGNISLDLIFALPGQTKEDWERSLREAAELSPEHLSAYSLILEEGTPLYQQRETLVFPDEETERGMYYGTGEMLRSYGFAQYEISNYARPGKECFHNTGYWTGVEYLGFGLGASSYLDGARFRNTDRMQEYISGAETPAKLRREHQILTENDLRDEYMILGLRMTQGISVKEFNERFGCGVREAYPGVIERYEKMGLLREQDGRLYLTGEGVSVSNVILADFMEG